MKNLWLAYFVIIVSNILTIYHFVNLDFDDLQFGSVITIISSVFIIIAMILMIKKEKQ